jgi:hypothetical protein
MILTRFWFWFCFRDEMAGYVRVLDSKCSSLPEVLIGLCACCVPWGFGDWAGFLFYFIFGTRSEASSLVLDNSGQGSLDIWGGARWGVRALLPRVVLRFGGVGTSTSLQDGIFVRILEDGSNRLVTPN